MDRNREHITKEGSREHVTIYSTDGARCPDCEVKDPNRELHELFGLLWHDSKSKKSCQGYECNCGFVCASPTEAIRHEASNPNYAADPRLVLRGMDKLPADKRKLFYAKLIFSGDNVEPIDDDGLIPRHYMTDTAGNLQQAAIDFLKGEL